MDWTCVCGVHVHVHVICCLSVIQVTAMMSRFIESRKYSLIAVLVCGGSKSLICLPAMAVWFTHRLFIRCSLRFRVAFCTFSLATSFAAMLLLPLSVFGNEIKHIYPDNYYVQWLTNSLVQGMIDGPSLLPWQPVWYNIWHSRIFFFRPVEQSILVLKPVAIHLPTVHISVPGVVWLLRLSAGEWLTISLLLSVVHTISMSTRPF